MKLIETSAELLPFIAGEDGIYKMIERAGRTCYKSTDKMTDDSAKPFVERMIKSGHTAMLEHGTVYLKVPVETWRKDEHEWTYMFPEGLPWVSLDCDGKYWYITTNFRHILEGNVGIKTMNKYLCPPTEFHEKRYTFKFTTDRGISHELVRHRKFSFAQESQRYCNYSKKRHGSEITFIIPSWMPQVEKHIDTSNGFGVLVGEELYAFLGKAERHYFYLLDSGLQPQQARDVLPNATKTEIIMTGFTSDWRFLLDLRLFEKTGKVHPDMLSLMQKTQKVMQEAGIWDDIMKYPSKFD